jgi:hypothetical protein
MSRPRTWPITTVVFLAACALHVAQPPRPASAQERGVAPDELTQAILRYVFRYDGGNVRLLEGRIPDDLAPNFYVPPGTRVLGSVVMGSGVLVLAKSGAPPESLRAEYTRALGSRGWTPLEVNRRRGFIDAAADLPLILCRDSAQLHIQHARHGAGSNDLFLHYRDGAGPCERPSPPAFRAMSEPPFPALYAPPGARGPSGTRCFSQRGRGAQTSTMITADIPAEELLRHYGGQLESAGWRRIAASRRSLAAGTWTRPDSAGTTELTLQVRETGTPGVRCYQVEMAVMEGATR